MNIIQGVGSFLAGIVLGVLSVGQTMFGFSKVVPETVPTVQIEKPQVINEVPPQPVPVALKPTPVYVDSDQIITCTSSYPNCLGKSLQVRQSECSKTYCCGIGDKWSLYLSEGQCKQAQQNAGNVTQNNYVPLVPSGQIKIKCDLSSGDYHYDFGEITYDECKRKSDDYFAQKRAEINNQNISPITNPASGKSPADIQKCKDDVRTKYNNLISGCYVMFQDTAANACARGYQDQSGTEWGNCEN